MDRKTIGALTGLLAVVTLPLGVLATLSLGIVPAVVVFLVGWFLVPAIPLVGEVLVEIGESDAGEDPIEEAKRAYARGEIDERELERRTGVLLEIEEAEREGEFLDSPRDRDRERERDREFDF